MCPRFPADALHALTGTVLPRGGASPHPTRRRTRIPHPWLPARHWSATLSRSLGVQGHRRSCPAGTQQAALGCRAGAAGLQVIEKPDLLHVFGRSPDTEYQTEELAGLAEGGHW